ncbi:glycosyltransferase [Microbulbifer sp. CnH-101-G]|uniref:glycosyltransferase n=1 Tax=Microbulbifer sp. CnH-101-G TaxID=3243393 RepID=UPI004039A047
MEKKITVNHVMSSDMHSAIFDAILGYFDTLKSDGFRHIVTIEPDSNADVYHFHRPNLAENIPENSICTVHHDLKDEDSWLDANSFIQAYRKCSFVVCLNSQQKNILNKEYGISKAVVIPHGVNKSLFDRVIRNEKRLGSERKYTLGVISKRYGRMVKGEYRLYELAKRLSPELYSFVLVGAGRLKDAQLLQAQGFEVLCYSYLPYCLMPQIYAELDGLLMLSNFEGGPANLPEAIYAHTPIFSTRVGMAVDLIDAEKRLNGFFLKEDFDEMASQINSYFTEEGKTINFTDVPDWQDIVSQYERLYLRIAQK